MYEARNTRTKNNCLKLIGSKKEREFIIFDTETTGLKPKEDYVVEFAGIKFKAKEGKMEQVESLDLYIQPPFKMNKKVISLHGITNQFLEDKPDEAHAYPVIKKFFGEKPILLAYNAQFDINMLTSMYGRQGDELKPQVVIDVLEMGRDLIKDAENYKLGTLVKDLGLEAGIVFHNALDDTTATARFLKYCYGEYASQEEEGKERVYINEYWFWKGHNKEQSGIYVRTNLGQIYYNSYRKCWRSSAVDLSKVDINALEKEITKELGISYNDFYHLTQSRYNALRKR